MSTKLAKPIVVAHCPCCNRQFARFREDGPLAKCPNCGTHRIYNWQFDRVEWIGDEDAVIQNPADMPHFVRINKGPWKEFPNRSAAFEATRKLQKLFGDSITFEVASKARMIKDGYLKSEYETAS